jgi:hypothetical protein
VFHATSPGSCSDLCTVFVLSVPCYESWFMLRFVHSVCAQCSMLRVLVRAQYLCSVFYATHPGLCSGSCSVFHAMRPACSVHATSPMLRLKQLGCVWLVLATINITTPPHPLSPCPLPSLEFQECPISYYSRQR